MAIKTEFNPTHPEKYNGPLPIKAKSLWELDFMRYCDVHPDIVQWAYEPTQIPYHDPLTDRQKVYIPDFLVTFITRGRQAVTKLIEIKPQHEAVKEQARNGKDALLTLRNDAKWKAATAWAMRRGITFQTWTEAQMYVGGDQVPGRRQPIQPERILAQVKKLTPKAPARRKKTQVKKKSPLRGSGSRVRKGAKVNTVSKARKAPKSRRR